MNKSKLDKIRRGIIERIRRFEKSPGSIFIRRRKLTYLIIAFLLFFGVMQIKNLPRELRPEVEIPVGVVTTVYPGASPVDVEEQITKKVETSISDVTGIKKIESSSNFSVSSISVEFEAGEDLEGSIRKLKDEVDQVKGELPEDANDPMVFEVSFEDMPIMVFSLVGSNYDKSELKEFAEDLKEKIKSIPDIQDVRVVGGEEKEIKVNINPEKLNELGLSLSQVIASINSSNINLPAGSIEIGEFSYAVRVQNQFSNAREISNLVIGERSGSEIRLKKPLRKKKEDPIQKM